MNKNLYRIVFNQARGMLMVVADIAASGRAASSPSSGVGHTQRRRVSALSPLSFRLLIALGCISLSAQAAIVADGSAPGNQQPTIISSANGTPQVNIQTPSSGGVSRNAYRQFDVDNRGVILNNGRGVNQTQIAGLVDGNPWLARGEASVILNEVNSRDPSQLNGYIEVAGRKAQVVIANPAGITCEGCGFINANRATLTTGQAQLNNGQLTGYDVERGEIVIQGKGLDSRGQDHTDLIARSVKVNAGIWANELNITTGRNQVDAAHQNINTNAADGRHRPAVAVDVANLGGMYAGKIRLIGTETGVGVHNAGEIGASAGDIVITADGMLVNRGQISSAQQLAVNTPSGIENSGVLYGKGNTQLTTAGKLSNSGTVAAAGDTLIRAAEVNSSRNSVLGAGIKSDNSAITRGTLDIKARGQLTAQGKNISGTAQTFNANRIDLSGSQTQSGDLTFTTEGGDIDLTGANLFANRRLSVSTPSLLRTDKANLFAEQIALDAQALANVGGVITQTGLTDFNLNLPGDIDNRDGTLLTRGNFLLQAEHLTSNSQSLLGAGIQSDGKLAPRGDLNVTTRHALIAQGKTLTAGTLALSGSRLDLTDSLTQAKYMRLTATEGDIALTGATVMAANTLFADTRQILRSDKAYLTADQINLTAYSLSNVEGRVVQKGSGDFRLDLPGYLDNRGGVLLTKGNLALQAERLTSNSQSLLGAGIQADGSKASKGDLQANTTQALIAQGQNVAAGTMTLSGSRVDLTGSQTHASNITITARDGDVTTREATLITPGTLSMTAVANPEQTLNNRGGKLHADNIQLNLAKLENSNGEIAAATDLWLRLQSDFIHQAGARLTAGRDLLFNSRGALINQYKLEAGRDMQLTALSIRNTSADRNTNADNSSLLAGRGLSLSTDSLFNRGAIYTTGVGQFTVNGNTENIGEIYTEQQLTFTATGNLANRGVMQTRGEMQLSAQGDVNNSGMLYSAGDQMRLSIAGNLTNEGKLHVANGEMRLLTEGNLDNRGSLYGAGNSDITTQGNAVNTGSVYTQGALQWLTKGSVRNSASIAALGDLQLRANDLLSDNQSLMAAGLKADGSRSDSGNLAVSTEQALIAQGQNIAAGSLALAGSQIDLTGSQTQANAISLTAKSGDITLTSAVIKAATQLLVTQLAATRSSFIPPSSIPPSSTQSSSTQASASPSAWLRTDKASLIADQLTFDVQALSNLGGVIAQTGATDFNLNLPGYLDNRGGTILSKGNVAIQAQGLDSDSGSLLGAGVQSDGKLTNAGDLAVTVRQDLIAHGQSLAAGAMTLTGSGVDLTGSQTQARGITITANKGDVSTQRANILSLGSLAINAGANAGQTLNNQGGSLQANNIALNLGQLDNRTGKIAASQDLVLGLQSDFNILADSTLQAGRDFSFTTHGALTNDGQLLAGRKLSTRSNSLLNNGNIRAVQADLRASGALTNRGEILTRGGLSTDANTLFNSGTLIGATATLNARERITNSGPNALIGATDKNGTLALLAPVIENSDTVTRTDTAPTTTLLGMGKVILAGGQDNSGNYSSAAQVLNLSGLIESGNDLLVYAKTLTNRRQILTATTDFIVGDTETGAAYWTAENPDIPGGRYTQPPAGGPMNSDYIGTNYTSTVAYNRIDQISPEAQLLAGGNLTLQVGTLENNWSKVSAQGVIDLTGVTLQQDDWGSQQRLVEQTTSSGEYRYRTYKGKLWGIAWGPEMKLRLNNQYASSITAKTLTGSGTVINNTVINNGAAPGAIVAPRDRDSTGKNIAVEFNGIALTLPRSGLYQLKTDKGDYAPGPEAALSLANISPPSSLDATGPRGVPPPSDDLNRTGLVTPDRAVSGGYLVETHPAFASLNNWKGSDLYLQQLSSDPSVIHKRLGDNAYEQRLLRDQVLALTGRTVASDYRSEQAQFEQLFAAGVQYSKAFNLAPGTRLSAEQMATLTGNIVLMENRDVAGQTVLVPVVYLAGVKPGDLRANGALIAAENISLTEVQGFANAGAISASNNLQISMAKDITLNNRCGLLQAGNHLQLSTLNSDIDLTSARLNATNLQLDSGRDVILRTASDQYSSGNGAVQRTQTILGPLASLNISNNAVITAQRDFIQQGAGINIGKDLQVNTGGDWLLSTVQRSDQISAQYGGGSATSGSLRHLGSEVKVGGALSANVDNLTAVGARVNAGTIDVRAQNITLSAATDSLSVTGGSSSKRHTSSVNLYDETLLGSQLNATGDINLQTVNDITLSASAVQTDGALKLAAGGDVTLTSQTEQHDEQRNHTGTKKGLLSSTTTRSEEGRSQTLAVGSMLSAGSIDVSSQNIAVAGSSVVADKDIRLRAQENLTVSTAQQSESGSQLFEQKKSGLMSTGGIGVFIGTSRQKTTDQTQTVSHVGSTVGSLTGNVRLEAGNQLTLHGSDVVAGKDLALTGADVAISAAENSRSQQYTAESKQRGLTVALSGPVGSAVNTAVTTAKAAREENTGRLAGLQGVKAALSGVQAVQAGQLVQAQGGGITEMVGVSVSLGSQKSSSQQQQEQTQVSGSALTAGNNLSIKASGSDILIAGSQLKAGGDTRLDAARDVQLLGAANRQKTDGSNSSRGGSVGVSVGGSGLSVFANANKGQGNERGDGTFWTETTVDSGGMFSLRSGRDTALTGAQVSAETVKADVGRNLTLQSQQDRDNYDAKQSRASGGISVPVAGGGAAVNLSMSRDRLSSQYDSVQAQTGIFAGSGGVDIRVGEHTQLDGAVIASTAAADKNTLDTGTLGFSDIKNKAVFTVEHQGGSLSTGGPVGSDLLSNLGGMVLAGLGNGGYAEGTTQAAVSEGTITVRDTENQQQNVDDLSRDTGNANGSIGPIFDKEKEQNRLKEVQLIGEIGGQALDIASTQGKIIATHAANDKMKAVKPEDIAAAEKQWEKAHPGKAATAEDINQQIYQTAYNQAFNESGFGTGGPVQRGMQAATAAVQGLAGGNMGAALTGASAPYLAGVIKQSTGDNPAANTMAHAVLGAVTAYASGNNALAGAAGAATAELMAPTIISALGWDKNTLTEGQKQAVSALSTLAAGLAGGLTGDSTADALAGGQAGKNAVENNLLGGNEFTHTQFVQKHGADVLSCADNPSNAACQRGIAENKAYIAALATGSVALLPGSSQAMWALGAGTNAGMQYADNGKINPVNSVAAGWINVITMGQGWKGTIAWNAAGGALINAINGGDPLTGAITNGTGAGFGYGVGNYVVKPAANTLGKWITGGWNPKFDPNLLKYAEVKGQLGISKEMLPSKIPSAVGNAGGSLSSEFGSSLIQQKKDAMEDSK
ncbi:contact-dependent inhibition toxin CdiA [Yersinia pestis]|uniref:Toxin CdiA n=50 Tax=Yersinia pestis TaxID=632 RepID=CDIA_YERPE|nr:contact-dependent inhibition toxin CdiA [Yersinia pestis]Q7CGD9.1 RecName: Full=Toxin CdiA [Yersinia pestis]ERP77717.1 adhesin [Yersinia pestis 24H]AAM87127.1 putative filamentous hemagglutinin [Yersinia pestis KIM10+]ABG15152.1 putative adhesin [Yersinia pestis Antiqua]ACY61218.1 putative adhesin [Yersinia pestis D182038]ADE63484.1 putative adhesin [Yersinia pestis Z176003]